MKRLLVLIPLLLAGCSDDRPPAPTPEETARLDETEAMLNNVTESQEGPETRVPSPSTNSD